MHDTDFLQFSKKERRGIAALFLLFLGIWFFPSLYERYCVSHRSPDLEAFALRWQHLHGKDSSVARPAFTALPDEAGEKTTIRLFSFDPNTLDEAGWKQLGLSERQTQTVMRYRGKGGRFRKAEDLRRLYGLPSAKAEELLPYVHIAGADEAVKKAPGWATETKDSVTGRPYRKTGPQPVEVNQADSSAFEALPGIGPVLARRLVNFREKLGGFWSIDQVGETFGMPDSTFQRIRPLLQLHEPVLRKIELNAATAEELAQHPYINRKAAREIVSYRQAHGPFPDPGALIHIQNLDPALRIKLIPYLSVSRQ